MLDPTYSLKAIPSLLGYLLISCDGVCKNPQLHNIETVIIILS